MPEDPIARYSAMLARSPANELARFSLGKALYDAGRYAEAADTFRMCLQKNAAWMFPTILLGRCQLRLGDKAAAKESLQKARQLAIDQHHEGPMEEIDGLLKDL